MTDLATRARDILETDPSLVEAMAAVGITLRKPAPGERAELYALTWVDAASGEPITCSRTPLGWEFLHWLAASASASATT
mgnify:FL=1